MMKLKDLEQAASPGPWQVWDSCSWRRICTERGGAVITPGNQQADNHPDLLAKREDLDLAVAARNALPELLGLLSVAVCPNAPKERNGEGCIDGKIQRYFHRDGAYFGDKPCQWCTRVNELLGGK